MAEERKSESLDKLLDDWASAVDEWGDSLAFPEGAALAANPAAAPTRPPPAPPPLAPLVADAPDPEEILLSEPLPPLPLPSSPSAPLPLGDPPLPSEVHSPLKELFDDDVDLPAETGEAFISMLTPDAALAGDPDAPPLYGEDDEQGGAATRVASSSELAPLLGAAVQRSLADSFDDESTRIAAAGEVERLLYDDTPEPPSPLVATPAAPPPAAAAVDDDFYDDIAIVPGREVASAPLATEAAAAAPAAAEPDPLFDLPIAVETPPAEPADLPPPPAYLATRSSDPDRTPLPVGDDTGGEAAAAPAEAAAVEAPAGTPLVAVRLAETAPLTVAAPAELAPRAVDAAELRQELAHYDEELRLADSDGERAALGYAAGRLAEQLDDRAGAGERYRAAHAADARHLPTLRALRRLALAAGDRGEALVYLERELGQASAAERPGLLALRAELALALGDRRLAAESHRSAAERDELGALAGLCDVASGDGDGALGAALERLASALAPSSDAAARATVAVERGRLDEAAGRAREAVARYREALALDPNQGAAAWGLLRVALRTPGEGDDAEAHARVIERLPTGPLRRAVERRLGLVQLRAGNPGEARPLLQAAASSGDRLALYDLARLEREAGRLDEARGALARVADAEPDVGQRADRLIELGALCEVEGNTAAASAAYARAAAEYPADPRAARALERTHAAGDDKESALARHLSAAERSPARAPREHTQAARLLRELGRHEEAEARLRAALAAAPSYMPAVELGVELALAGGRPDDAAAALAAAAAACGVPALALALRERAARLLAQHGAFEAALGAASTLAGDTDATAPARWLEQRLLGGWWHEAGKADPGWQVPLRHSLVAEAERAATDGDTRRATQLWYDVAAGADASEARELYRRVLGLDPTYAPAAMALLARLSAATGADAAPAEVIAIYEARLDGAGDRPEALALALRLGAAHEGAGDAAAALAVYLAAERRAAPSGGNGVLRDAIDRAARRANADTEVLAALERELEATVAPEARFALLVAIGERVERRLGQPERAAERYRQALELRPGHAVAREALERAYKGARNWSALADLHLGDLKEAPDPRTKVAAYERLAYVDGELRGERSSALYAFESIIEVDHANHAAMRVLERHYLDEGRTPELVALYEQMGLTASDPAFGVAVALERARLRRRLTGPEVSAAEVEAAIDNDYRLALFKDRRARVALRHVYGKARAQRDLGQLAELAQSVADALGDDARAAAVFLTRSADALVEQDKNDEALARYWSASERLPQHLPALVGATDVALLRGEWPLAAQAAEQLGAAARDRGARARALVVAGAIAEERLGEPERAMVSLRAALAIEPRHQEAFTRLERLLVASEDHQALASLYQRRLEVETDGARLLQLHLMLGRILRDQLGDRARARAELRAVLAQDPTHAEALAELGDLLYQDEQWAEAAEALIRRARGEKDRAALREIFFKLGVVYADHLPDPKRAVAAFSRVLQITPDDVVALEQLSAIQLREHEWRGALAATLRLTELENDKPKRVAHLHRVARIYEEGFKDPRRALEALRRALELDPLYLPAVGELARFFDRQSDVQSLRVHLDRTAARVRALTDANPYDVEAYRSLFQLFGWRRAPDRAALCAGVIEWLGAAADDERAAIAAFGARDHYPGVALADPALDDALFDPRVPAGFRHLFRLLDEPLAKMFRADVRRLGVGKHEKLPRSGHPARDLANRLGADLGVRDLDLYITAAHPNALVVELTDPLAIVLGNKLVEGASELELRFILGRCLKMMQCRMALPMRLLPDDLGLLVAGIVRQFVPDFAPVGFDGAQVAAEAGRLGRVIPRKLHAELLPFALECASDSIDLKQIGPALVHSANRAGLIACGLPGPALAALRRLGDEAQVRVLLRFCVSEELGELRRQLGVPG